MPHEPTHPPAGLHTRMPGERFWWVSGDGALVVRSRAAAPAMTPIASGRVCDEARIGVIERCAGCDATLGLVGAGLVDLLARRFPGVRWAVADTPARVPVIEPATA